MSTEDGLWGMKFISIVTIRESWTVNNTTFLKLCNPFVVLGAIVLQTKTIHCYILLGNSYYEKNRFLPNLRNRVSFRSFAQK
ncbi:MAG: hypothetical protein ACRCT1_05570 [Microcoleaceae cyanobacterium]